MINKNKNDSLLDILEGRTVIRGKISYTIIIKYLLDCFQLTPKELYTKQSIESLWFKVSNLDKLTTEHLLTKEFKKNSIKKALESLYLDKSKEEENIEIIDDLMIEIEEINEDYKDSVQKAIEELKTRLQLFFATDLSNTEKQKFIRDILGEYHNFILTQLEKEREIQLPIGKFSVRTHNRFNTKNIHFEPVESLKNKLIQNSEINSIEIEKQREMIKENVLNKGKHLSRLNKNKGVEDE